MLEDSSFVIVLDLALNYDSMKWDPYSSKQHTIIFFLWRGALANTAAKIIVVVMVRCQACLDIPIPIASPVVRYYFVS